MNPTNGIELWVPGRTTKWLATSILVSVLIALTLTGAMLSVLPGLVNTIFPWVNHPTGSLTKSNTTPNGLVSSGPGVSLPPGTVHFGTMNRPMVSQVVDSSILPRLTSTSDSFVYQTSFGVYSFNRTSPFVFSLWSSSGTPLTKASVFRVVSLVQLTLGGGNVTIATDNQYQVHYQVLLGSEVVGILVLQVDFSASVRPKFTISFSKTAFWTFGSFNIVWSTFTFQTWLRSESFSPVNLQTISAPKTYSNASRVDVGSAGDPSLWTEWVTTDWSDAPGGNLEAGYLSTAGFSGYGHEVVFRTNVASIDPTQISTSTATFATAYSTQRKTFSYGGYYFTFFYDGSNIVYASSQDGVHWPSPTFIAASGPISGYSFDVYQSNATVALDWYNFDPKAKGDGTTQLLFRTGTIVGSSISWIPVATVAYLPQPYSWPSSVAIGTDGTFWAAGIWYPTNKQLAYEIFIYSSTDGLFFTLSNSYYSEYGGSRDEALQLVPLQKGSIMLLSSHYYGTDIRWTIWHPYSASGAYWDSVQSLSVSLPSSQVKWNLMSATSSPDGFAHLIFQQYTTSYQLVWGYYNSTSAQWQIGPQIFSGSILYPSIASDGLGNLYAFWMNMSSSQPKNLMFSTKLKAQSWNTPSQPFGSGSSIVSATWVSTARSVSKEVIVSWTLSSSSPYKIFYGSVPLPSGVASGPPARPWSRLGLTPYEQYFTQNGEYVSPGNGLLTVSQTDISVQGRNGLNSVIARVYTEPFTFLNGNPYNLETSPYANLGNGWQLNLPWVGPQYFHYAYGETFPLVWTSYNTTSNTWTLENHQTEDFILTKTLSGYTMTMKDGTLYNFNGNGLLTSLVDRTGQNQISFSYAGGLLSSITDTVGRTAALRYNTSNQLANVTYGGQIVKYGYSGSDLVTVTDALGRMVTLKYTGQSNWLLTGVVYTSGGNSTYTYGSIPVGTDALNYYVTLQNVDNPGSIVKTSSFSYNITDGEITSTIVKQSDGFTVQGYTNYLFNAKSSSLTRSILNGTQVQMLKTQFWYDPVTGRSVQRDVYSGTSISRSFYNSQFFDIWGNVIYNKDNTGHESYQSFANTNTQWTFQSPGSLATTVGGRLLYDDFTGPTLNSTAWATGGSASSSMLAVASSLLNITASSSSSGTLQGAWVRSTSTYGFPFYAEVQTSLGSNPGLSNIDSDFMISPQATVPTGNPYQNLDSLRLIVNSGPDYKVAKNVGGVQTVVYDSGLVQGGSLSVSWKVILTDQNTLTVYLNSGSGYSKVYSTSTLGLSTSFSQAYLYLAFYNLLTIAFSASFDYVGLTGSNSVTVNNLQGGQKVQLYDWNNNLQTSGIVALGQTSITLNGTQMIFPYGYFQIYQLDSRTVQFTSATREIYGGGTYTYTAPFRSGGVTRTGTGFLQSTTDYVDDNIPSGAIAYSDGGDAWVWTTSSYGPIVSGTQSHVSVVVSGTHEHYFNGSSTTITPASGSFLIQYVYIPSASAPSEIMLQFHTVGGNWEHRAYWGSNLISACGTTGSTCGTNGTPSRLPMGPLPSIQNSWVELNVKADDVGVNGLSINGWAYTLYNGGVFWDYSALGSSSTGTITVNNLLAGQKVELYDSTGSLRTSAIVATGQTTVTLNVYSPGINVFPLSGYIKAYSTSGGLQYSSSLTTDVWGGDIYSYNQPVFSNSFNPGPVGSAIRNVPIGSAQYQNATSTPEQDYANYDALGDMLQDSQIHNGSPLTTTYTFDTYGNKASMINPDNEKTYYTYSSTYQHAYLTNTTQVLTALINVTTSYTYNFTTGMKLTVKDPMGNVTSYQYDTIDRTTMVKFASVNGVASNMTVLYQDSQNSFGLENPKGNYTDFNYDGLGRLTNVNVYKGALNASPVVSGQNDTYNWQNKIKTFQNPTGNITTYTYDYLGRIVKVVNPDGSTRTTSYDDVNLIRSSYDENRHRTDDLYDPLQRLIGVREFVTTSSFLSTSYVYQGVGNLGKIVAANGQTTTYTYDDLNRLVLTIFPDGYNATRSYDNIGNMISAKDPNGKITNYNYDAINRLVNVTYPDSSKATYTYDKNSNRLSLAYLGNSATFSYDSKNRETGETWTIGGSQFTLSYAYDKVGNLVAITYPDGTKVTFSIDSMNRATTVNAGGTTLATINYRADSSIANITYGNGVQTTYHYDKRGRATEVKVVQGSTTLLDLNYGYDAVGNVLSIGTESYSYDYLNRLTNATGPWGTIKYGYDSIGNRLWLYQISSNTTYTYGPYNRLTSAGSTSYTYDNNGNRITSASGGTTTNYGYDFENRLTSVWQGSSTLGNYTYSPLGQRIQKIESSTTTTYLNGGINVLYEKVGTTVNDYVFNGNQMIARITGSTIFYFHQDILGSTRLVTTGSTTSFSSNYEPFGTQYNNSGTDPIYKYTAKPQDQSTGLYYYSARYYDTSTGRFITRDPARQPMRDPQQQCPYIYARNNPERFTDPSGQCINAFNLALDLVQLAFNLLGVGVNWSLAYNMAWDLATNWIPVFAGFLAHWDVWDFAAGLVSALWQDTWTIIWSLAWWQIAYELAVIAGGFWWATIIWGIINLVWSLAWQIFWPPWNMGICSNFWSFW